MLYPYLYHKDDPRLLAPPCHKPLLAKDRSAIDHDHLDLHNLTRISHKPPTAAAHLTAPQGLRLYADQHMLHGIEERRDVPTEQRSTAEQDGPEQDKRGCGEQSCCDQITRAPGSTRKI